GCCLASRPGAPRSGTWGSPLPAPGHRPLLRAAVGPVLAALPHEALRMPTAAVIDLVLENFRPATAAYRLSGIGLLERARLRANQASGPLYRLPARAPVGHDDRFRLDRLGFGAPLPSLDDSADLHGPGRPRRGEVPHPCPSSVALESIR